MTDHTTTSLKLTVGWLFNERLRWVYHMLFWVFIYLDEFLSVFGLTEDMGSLWYVPFSLAVDMLVVYATIYVLLPLFLMVGRVWYFIGFSLFLVLLNITIQLLIWFPIEMFYEETVRGLATIILTNFVHSALLVGFAAGIKIFKHYILNESKIKKLETDNLKTELVYLKNQINPHFLFNSLNNIYVLSRKDAKMTSESILLLSDLLRYQLYDCNKERVNLEGEVEYLRNFLGLDQLRKDNTTLQFDVKGNVMMWQIAPYIFLPFVENAIKHGSSANNEKGYLKISIEVDEKGKLDFSVENSIPEFPLTTETGGIGLTNVRRRLDLVYPDEYQLDISHQKTYYRVTLSLDLNQ